MSDGREIHAGHPIWKELRNGLLWHRTGVADCRQIRTDGFIKPNDSRVNGWGGHYACQQLGGLSLFDFTSQSEDRVLGEAGKWQQFLGNAGSTTVLLGMERGKLMGKLVPYPDCKTGTTGNVIPWVEVCHCGPNPVSAVVAYLLVCSADFRQFKKLQVLDDASLSRAESEFTAVGQAESKERAELFQKIITPEFKAQMEEARRLVAKVKSDGGGA